MRGQLAEALVGELLQDGIRRLRAAGSELPRLDAELLVGHAAGLDRTAVVAHPEWRLDADAVRRVEAALARRERGEPVAYIRGSKEFHGLALRVDARALIPRPEAELLVDRAVRSVADRLAARPRDAVRVVDVGTGSGAIAIALATTLRDRGLLDRVAILATDQSAAALALAAENLERHGLAGAVTLTEADLLPAGPDGFDVVLANLPYIPSGAIDDLPIAASFEPRVALDGGPDGLVLIRRLLSRLPATLVPGGSALLEIGSEQEAGIGKALATLLPGWRWRVERDLSGLPRVAVVEAPAGAGSAAPVASKP